MNRNNPKRLADKQCGCGGHGVRKSCGSWVCQKCLDREAVLEHDCPRERTTSKPSPSVFEPMFAPWGMWQ